MQNLYDWLDWLFSLPVEWLMVVFVLLIDALCLERRSPRDDIANTTILIVAAVIGMYRA